MYLLCFISFSSTISVFIFSFLLGACFINTFLSYIFYCKLFSLAVVDHHIYFEPKEPSDFHRSLSCHLHVLKF